MNSRIKKVVNVKLSAILAGATIALSGSTLPASAQVPVPNVSIDVNKTYDQINQAIKSHKDRAACVKVASEAAYSAVERRYNVMVFNMAQNYSTDFPGGAQFNTVQCGDKPFGVWIFGKGTFTNGGDGGYINWAFQGKFTRTGDQGHTVIFDAP